MSINTFNRICNEVRLDFPFLYFVWIRMHAGYRTLIQIMLNLFILHEGKQFGLFGNYHSEHIATFCMV